MQSFGAGIVAVSLGGLLAFGAARAETSPSPGLTQEPRLYVVGYAHLDTEWRWEYPQVIDEYLRKTMEDNFTLFEQISPLRFQFQRREPLPPHEGIFSGRFREAQAIRRMQADGFRRALPWRRAT